MNIQERKVKGHVEMLRTNSRRCPDISRTCPGYISEIDPHTSRNFPGMFREISWTCPAHVPIIHISYIPYMFPVFPIRFLCVPICFLYVLYLPSAWFQTSPESQQAHLSNGMPLKSVGLSLLRPLATTEVAGVYVSVATY